MKMTKKSSAESALGKQRQAKHAGARNRGA